MFKFISKYIACERLPADEGLWIVPLTIDVVPCAVANHDRTVLTSAARLAFFPVCKSYSRTIDPFVLFFFIVVGKTDIHTGEPLGTENKFYLE